MKETLLRELEELREALDWPQQEPTSTFYALHVEQLAKSIVYASRELARQESK